MCTFWTDNNKQLVAGNMNILTLTDEEQTASVKDPVPTAQ